VISILSITALANSAYAIIAPFLPFEFQRKGIDQDWIGYIFSIYSVAVIFGSPMVGTMIKYIGRRNLIMLGMFLMGASFLLFGLISEIENKNLFISLSLVNRFLQGLSSSMIQTTMYSISTNFYPDNKESMVGYIEAVTGVGLIMGPLIGSFLFAIGGYKFIFYSFGFLFLISSFFIKAIFPKSIDNMGMESLQTSNE
jgi:MFS family permease